MTDPHHTPGPPALRVGTAEREQAAAALGKHFTDGRLDITEYDDRVARAYAAKTTTDLAELFTDLPAPPSQLTTPIPHRRTPSPLVPIAAIAILVFGTAIAITAHIVPIFLFPLLFFLFLHHRRDFGHRRFI